MSNELANRCRFCGELKAFMSWRGDRKYQLHCSGCGTTTPWCDSREAALAEWNLLPGGCVGEPEARRLEKLETEVAELRERFAHLSATERYAAFEYDYCMAREEIVDGARRRPHDWTSCASQPQHRNRGRGDHHTMTDMINETVTTLVQEAARAAHEMNRTWCALHGDFSQQPWDDAPAWQRQSAMAGVRAILANPATTPEQSHEGWSALKRSEGWVYGPVKDPERKTHPCLVPYAELPPMQRSKDAIFGLVVRAKLGIREASPADSTPSRDEETP